MFKTINLISKNFKNKLSENENLVLQDSLSFLIRSKKLIRFNLILFLIFGMVYSHQKLKWIGQINFDLNSELSPFLDSESTEYISRLKNLDQFYKRNKDVILSKLKDQNNDELNVYSKVNNQYKIVSVYIASKNKKRLNNLLTEFSESYIKEYQDFIDLNIKRIIKDVDILEKNRGYKFNNKSVINNDDSDKYVIIYDNLDKEILKLNSLISHLNDIEIISVIPNINRRYKSITIPKIIFFFIIASLIFSLLIRYIFDKFTKDKYSYISYKLKIIPFPFLGIYSINNEQNNISNLLKNYSNQFVLYFSLSNKELNSIKRFSKENNFILQDPDSFQVTNLQDQKQLLIIVGSGSLDKVKVSKISDYLTTKKKVNVFWICLSQL